MRSLHRRRWSPVAIDGATDTGPRPENQDRWAVGDAWAVVCDGVGGHRGGATAAQVALDAVVGRLDATPTAGALRAGVEAANAAVLAGRAADPAVDDMATTLTAAVRVGDRRWSVLQVGDSPAWVVGAGAARAVTWDHNLVGDLVRSGAITAEQAIGHRGRHLITRAVGLAATVEPEVFTVDLAAGEALVVASDGLSDVASPADAVAPLAAAVDAGAAAHGLVALALARDTHDNVTVVVVR